MKLLLMLMMSIANSSCGKSEDPVKKLVIEAKKIQEKTTPEKQSEDRQTAIWQKLGKFKTMEEYRKYVAEISNEAITE